MKELSLPCLSLLLLLSPGARATIRLNAITRAGNPTVTLQWNMVDYPGNTAYTLYKSADGINWVAAAANPIFRRYTMTTILACRDNFSQEEKLFYKVKVYDMNDNIVEVSNTAIVPNPVKLFPSPRRSASRKNKETAPPSVIESDWKIFGNPVGDILHLMYQGNALLKGVINIFILDGTGKSIIKFRAASNNKKLQIPVHSLHQGMYFLRIVVDDQVLLNETFIKE